MTSSIKDTTVTDANDAYWLRGRAAMFPNVPDVRQRFERIADRLEAMEAKPDPEGDGVREAIIKAYIEGATDVFKSMSEDETPWGFGDPSFAEAARDYADEAVAALTAKPSLEPTRTELVEALAATCRHLDDIRRAGRGSGETMSVIENARALLSRKQSGGGNG